MSLYSALRAGVSGLFAQSQSIAMISDNIANVNTNGYRLARASFNSLVTQGTARSGAYVAGSVRAQASQQITVNGSVSSSSNNLDLSIAGSGFFAVSESVERPPAGTGSLYYEPSGDVLYTRNGEFRRDANGNLKNLAGYYLLGWPVTGSNAQGQPTFNRTNLPSTLSAVTVSSTTGRPMPTRNLTINANVDRGLLESGEEYAITANVYDRQGGVHQMRLRFQPVQETTSTAGANPTSFDGFWLDVNADGVRDDNEPQEPYAFRLIAEFEDDSSARFRNGTTTTVTEMYAAFDSVGNFKYFLQPAADSTGARTIGVLGDPTNDRDGATGRYIAAGDTTIDPPQIPQAGGAAVPGGISNGLLAPLPPSDHAAANLDAFYTNARLSDLRPNDNERLYDTGALTQTGPAAGDTTYITQGVTQNRPDWRIIGTNNGGANQPYVIDANGGLSASTALVLDIDAAGDGFLFNGLPDAGNAAFENDFQLRLEFGATGAQDGLTLYNSPSTITNIAQDGRTVGQLQGIQVSEEGYVTAVYDNGERSVIAQVPVVGFNAANSLEVVDRNAFRETRDSGIAVVRFPGTAESGRLAPSTVEASNVDIAAEFTNMIIAQRAYSANTKIITTADEMLDELIRAKR